MYYNNFMKSMYPISEGELFEIKSNNNPEYIYLVSCDAYLTRDGSIYSEEELDMIMEEESRWEENIPHYSIKELMEIFPESIKMARRSEKNRIKSYKNNTHHINEMRDNYYNMFIIKAFFKEQNKLKKESNRLFDDLQKINTNNIKKSMYVLSYLDLLEGKISNVITHGVSEDEIKHARSVSIQSIYDGKIIKLGRLSKAICPFHKEKTPSLTIYNDQNSWWCYGCNTGGDVIKFFMQQNNVNFVSAVKQLIS